MCLDPGTSIERHRAFGPGIGGAGRGGRTLDGVCVEVRGQRSKESIWESVFFFPHLSHGD